MGCFIKWVDDFLGIRKPDESWTELDFINLSESFGVPWKTSKTRAFAPVQKYIGFWWNLHQRSVSLPEEKKILVLSLIQDWSASAAAFTMKETLQFHGRLVHISCIYPLIRPFIHSLVRFAYSFRNPTVKLHVPNGVATDLSWVRYIIELMPIEMPLSYTEPRDIGWWGDASSSYGVSVVISDKFAVWKWIQGFRVGPKQRFDIKWAETVAIYLGLKLGIKLGLAPKPEDNAPQSPILVRSDNESLCKTMVRGKSRNENANHVLKEIYRLLAHRRSCLKAIHVSSANNISDCLSRGDFAAFARRFPSFKRAPHFDLPDFLADKLTPSMM